MEKKFKTHKEELAYVNAIIWQAFGDITPDDPRLVKAVDAVWNLVLEQKIAAVKEYQDSNVSVAKYLASMPVKESILIPTGQLWVAKGTFAKIKSFQE